MDLTPELVDTYRKVLQDPAAYHIPHRSLAEIFVASDTITASHELAAGIIGGDYSQLPKVVFYIVLHDVYGPPPGKDASGNLGYYLKYVPKPDKL